MPKNNAYRGWGEVAARPYFDMVPCHNRRDGQSDRIAFFKVLMDFPRDASQALDDTHQYDRLRVVAYGKLAESLRGKVKPGDWLLVLDSYIQNRRRSKEGAADGEAVIEVVLLDYKHYMRPFVPGTPLMTNLERLAETRGTPVRDLMTEILEVGCRQMSLDLQLAGVNSG